jgi:hypothetical protein
MTQDFLTLFASVSNIVILLLKPNEAKRTEYELIWICGDLSSSEESKGIYYLRYMNDKFDALTPVSDSYEKIVKLSTESISSFAEMSSALDRSMESETTLEDNSAVSSITESPPDLSSEQLSARMWQPPDASAPPSSSLPEDSDVEEDIESAIAPLLPAALQESEVCSSPVLPDNISSTDVPLVDASNISSQATPDSLANKLVAAEDKLSKFTPLKSQRVWTIESLHNCTAPSTFLQLCDRVVNLSFVDTSLRPVKDRTHRYYTASNVQKRLLYNVWQYYAKSAPAQFKSWAIFTILLPVDCEDPPKTWDEYSRRFPESPHPSILGGLWGTNCGKEVVVVGNLQGMFITNHAQLLFIINNSSCFSSLLLNHKDGFVQYKESPIFNLSSFVCLNFLPPGM